MFVPFHELAIFATGQASRDPRSSRAPRAGADPSTAADANSFALRRWLVDLDGAAAASAAASPCGGGAAGRCAGGRAAAARASAGSGSPHANAQQQPHHSPSQQQPLAAANAADSSTTAQAREQRGTVRIFVSSTFSDMTRERDLVATRVAPRVQAFCDALGIVATFVDLRWGVTSEQAGRHDAARICLEQVLCCDIALVFCGDRYGWHACSNPNGVHGPGHDGGASLIRSMQIAAAALDLPWLDCVNSSSSAAASGGATATATTATTATAAGNSISKRRDAAATYLLRSSMTELEIRCALHALAPQHVHAFLRGSESAAVTSCSPSESSATAETCPEAMARLQALRRAVAQLPTAQSYDGLDTVAVGGAAAAGGTMEGQRTESSISVGSTGNNNNSGQHPLPRLRGGAGATSAAAATPLPPTLHSADDLEQAVFAAVTRSITALFPTRSKLAKPRKWERESAIQAVRGARALVGFCADI